MEGTVKSWNGAKGFGFIVSDSFAGDIFFSRNELPPDAREVRGKFLDGCTVTFEAATGPDGRHKATSVTCTSGGGKDGDLVAGVIKTYSERNGYGFVNSTSLTEDARFDRADLPPLLPGADLMGKLVNFTTERRPDGKLKVSKMMFQSQRIAQGVTAGAAGAAQVFHGAGKGGVGGIGVGQTMSGTVKSYSERNGYGFITTMGCPVDIKFGAADLPPGASVSAGTAIQFVPALGPNGGMLAAQLQVQGGAGGRGVKRPAGGKGAFQQNGQPQKLPRWSQPQPEPERLVAHWPKPKQAVKVPPNTQNATAGAWMQGTVKSYSSMKGFGFITSPEVQGDIYFMRTELPAQSQQSTNLPGQAVQFQLAYAPDGKVRASGLTVA